MYGTPVLGADIGGIPELIQVGKTGELFESGNQDQLKNMIHQWWKKLGAETPDISEYTGVFQSVEAYTDAVVRGIYQ